MKVRVSFEMTVQPASKEVCQQLDKPAGTIEVLDTDGDRYCFAESEAEAYREIRELVWESLTVSTLDVQIQHIDSRGGSSVIT